MATRFSPIEFVPVRGSVAWIEIQLPDDSGTKTWFLAEVLAIKPHERCEVHLIGNDTCFLIRNELLCIKELC